MALKLICGPTGSGKTARAIDTFLAAIDQDKHPLFIAPSRPDCLHFKRRILEGRPVLTGGRIITFGDLILEIIEMETALVSAEGTAPGPESATASGNKTTPVRVLGKTEQLILLRAITEGPAMPETLRESSNFGGFITGLVSLIGELESVGIKPGRLGEGLKGWAGGDSWRRGFNKDLFRLFQEYETVLDEKGVEDVSRMERRAVDILARNHSLLESHSIIVDGFHDFTSIEMDLIHALLDSAAEMLITLPFESGRAAFAAPACYFDQLKAGAEVILLEDSYEDQRAPAIRHIAENLFEEEAGTVAADGAVAVLQAAGVRGQAELVAAEVLRLWREEKMGLDDITVVTHSHGPDSLAVASAFADFGIPYEMQAPTPLALTPVGRSAMAALRLAAALEIPGAENEGGDLLLAYLRSPLTVADRDKVDSFDRYTRTHDTSDLEVLMLEWKKLSDQPLDDIYHLLEAAGRHMEPLTDELVKVMRRQISSGLADATPDKIEMDAIALKNLISTCSEASMAQDLVCDYPNALLAENDTAASSRLLGQLIQAIEMSSMHPKAGSRRNCVRLLDPHRVLNQRFDAIFICGLLEGRFPSLERDSVFFNEGDRDWLRENAGLPLRSNGLRLDEERFFFYRTLTRARHKVYLCYPYCDEEGRTTIRSLFIDDTLDLLSENSWDGVEKNIGEVAFPAETTPTATQALLTIASLSPGERRSPATDARLIKIAKTASLDARLKHCLGSTGLNWPNIGDEVKEKLSELEFFRITELEAYLKCPFRYFIEKIIKPGAMERPAAFLTRGSAVHEILKDFLMALKPAGVLLSRADDGQIKEARRILAGIIEEKLSLVDTDLESAVMKIEIGSHLGRFIDRERQMRPQFEPYQFEWSFGICDGKPGGHYDEETMLRIDDVKLCGRIDRVDIRQGKNQAVVIDYKTSMDGSLPAQKQFEKKGIIQIPLYMLALRDIWGLEPVGGEYYGIVGNRRRGLYLKEFAEVLGASSPETYSNEFVDVEIFEEKIETAKRMALNAARGIRSGCFDCEPLDEALCKNCRFGDICRKKELPPKAVRPEKS